MNPASMNVPRFGAFGDKGLFAPEATEEEITARLDALQETTGDLQFQQALSQMPVDELVMQLGKEQGSAAVIKTGGKVTAPEIMPVQGPDGQLFAMPLETLMDMLGLGGEGVKTFKDGFQGSVDEQKDKLVETAHRRTKMIREEVESRITLAEAFGHDEVPSQPGKKEDDSKERGIGVDTLKRLLDRTA